jgi:hypothetical protein
MSPSLVLHRILLWLLAGFCLTCNSRQAGEQRKAYQHEIDDWRAERLTRLKSHGGWLNVSGLYWLEQGYNTFGSDSSNDAVFPPDAPGIIGMYVLEGNSLRVEIMPGIPVRSGDSLITEAMVKSDETGNPTELILDSLLWFVIKRGSRYGIRLRNFNHPAAIQLKSLDYYPVALKWRITGVYKPFDQPKKVAVQTIVNLPEEFVIPGVIAFEAGGRTIELQPYASDQGFFIVFADATNGSGTYPAGRFLYAEPPDSCSRVVLDFNKAYNPPCAFTPFATCPLPAPENRMPVKVKAGEKYHQENIHFH